MNCTTLILLLPELIREGGRYSEDSNYQSAQLSKMIQHSNRNAVSASDQLRQRNLFAGPGGEFSSFGLSDFFQQCLYRSVCSALTGAAKCIVSWPRPLEDLTWPEELSIVRNGKDC